MTSLCFRFVTDVDVSAAIRIMVECFVNTQKASVMKPMRKVCLV